MKDAPLMPDWMANGIIDRATRTDHVSQVLAVAQKRCARVLMLGDGHEDLCWLPAGHEEPHATRP